MGLGLLALVVWGCCRGDSGGPAEVLAIVGLLSSGALLLLGGLLWGFAILWQRRVDRMFAGDRFVHWHFAADEWQTFLAAERRPRFGILLWLLIVVGGVIGLVVGISYRAREMPPSMSILFQLGVPMVVGLAAAALVARAVFGWQRRRYALLLAQPGEVVIGREGLYLCAEFWPWRALSHAGRALRYVPEPTAHLVAVFETDGGGREVIVPVPRGREVEAEQLVGRVGSGKGR